MTKSGFVFNIQRYSVHDGPGIRTTVFFKGCPLRCAWCHNPEGIAPKTEIMLVETRCIACGECRKACVHALGAPGEGPLPLRMARCDLCGACCEACPADARRTVGKEMTVDQVMDCVLQDCIFFEESGGGVTFSGGEPLMQPKFLYELLSACRSQGLHTAVDTCGMAAKDDLLAIAPLTHLFLYDVKLMEDAPHRRYTGASNEHILQNLRALAQVHTNIWVRVPLVPGVNDQTSALAEVAKMVSALPSVRQVNVLPYHATGAKKTKRLGQTGGSRSMFQPPSATELAEAVKVFEHAGLAARIGG